MKIIVFGGDGFCGWPTSLHLAAEGHEVYIVDNLSRRKIDEDLKSSSLTNISSIEERIEVANEKVGKINFHNFDISENIERLRNLIGELKPDAVVHFAEQRAAPYSMLGDHERRYTVDNNIKSTHNICSAIADLSPETHIVHLGTMGVYGYSKEFGAIPEGYLNIRINQTEKDTDILYPANPGSIYHMTKCLDQLIFQFYTKNWGLKVTDLHQGIVWGINTNQTIKDKRLVNRFDYDGIYGTVLNRFLSQAANGHNLSVYGTGGQSRAFINVADTANCINLAIMNDNFDSSKVRIFNQVSEVRSVLELAKIISKLYGVEIDFLDNPRKELSENDLEVSNIGLTNLGFKPITLQDGLLDDVKVLAEENKNSFDFSNVMSSPKW